MKLLEHRIIQTHLIFWGIYLFVSITVGSGYEYEFYESFLSQCAYLPLQITVAYVNYFLILPGFLISRRIGQYAFFTFITVIPAGVLQRLIDYRLTPLIYPDGIDYGIWLPNKFFYSTFIIALPMIFLVALSLILHVWQLQEKARQLENDKLQAELNFLKSQINPHFLFNTLNNIYGLALSGSTKVPALILKFSDYLSYTLFEASAQGVPISKEIELIESFIELEKERFGNRLKVKFSKEVLREKLQITPLLLMPFVENAFKHGIRDETRSAKVEIELKVTGDLLQFRVFNTVPDIKELSRTDSMHIGLKNTKRRLNLLFGENHSIDIDAKRTSFEINLTIKL